MPLAAFAFRVTACGKQDNPIGRRPMLPPWRVGDSAKNRSDCSFAHFPWRVVSAIISLRERTLRKKTPAKLALDPREPSDEALALDDDPGADPHGGRAGSG